MGNEKRSVENLKKKCVRNNQNKFERREGHKTKEAICALC
jgi:hypothetical protein